MNLIKIEPGRMEELERILPGIKKSIIKYDQAILPECSHCGSPDTAEVHCGIVSYTIHLASATTKFKLIPNSPVPGKYFCNTCKKYFD